MDDRTLRSVEPSRSKSERIPPHNVEAEAAVLGAVLAGGRTLLAEVTAAGIEASSFYDSRHETVFAAMLTLDGAGTPVDIVTVADHLNRLRLLEMAGGTAHLAELQAATTASTTNARSHAAILVEHERLRRLVNVGGEIAEMGYRHVPSSEAQARATELLTRAAAAHPNDDRARPGGSFILDQPEGVPAVWGAGDEVLWAQGESLLIVGPAGVGKSTLAGQLVLCLANIIGRADLLGYPVAELGPGDRVLYLACDRPAQIARGMRRLVHPEHRALLDERLVVRPGPPPGDFATNPSALVELAAQHRAGVVVIDSLKDVALGLSDDKVGAGLNNALQRTLAEGVEVLALHHQRKGQDGRKPQKLEDVYGSTWITAGAGSVVLLWGNPGDPIVELRHLKQPAGDVGPLTLEHDHVAGITKVQAGFDPLTCLRHAPTGLTALEVARIMLAGSEPDEVARRKAQRRLDRLVNDGHAHRIEGTRGGSGGTTAARYVVVDVRRQEPA